MKYIMNTLIAKTKGIPPTCQKNPPKLEVVIQGNTGMYIIRPPHSSSEDAKKIKTVKIAYITKNIHPSFDFRDLNIMTKLYQLLIK